MKDLTWIATLYPEEAPQAFAVDEDFDVSHSGLPLAEATPIEAPAVHPWRITCNSIISEAPIVSEGKSTGRRDGDGSRQSDNGSRTSDGETETPASTSPSPSPERVADASVEDHPCSGGRHRRPIFFLEGIICGLITATALFACFFMEVFALSVYLVAVALHKLSIPFGKLAVFTGPIFSFLVQLLLFCDSVILAINVLVIEILAGIACFLGCLLGGCCAGPAWRNYIRKTCHLSRWAFRHVHSGWEPRRIFPIKLNEAVGPESDEIDEARSDPVQDRACAREVKD